MSQPPRKGRSKPQPPEQTSKQAPEPMIDPHGDVGDVISDVPSLSVDEVEKRIGARERARGEGVRSGAPARGRTAPAPNRRVTLWRDSATILIFVLIAVLAARFMLNGSGTATASPTLEPTGVAVTESPGDSGFLFSFTPSFGPPVDPSSGLNASPTPIPVITLPPLAPPTAPSNASATRGNQAVDVTWNAPTSNGGSFITTYQATSKPGGKTCSAKVGIHICTVGQLTNGVAYTFTVTATNAIGTSPPSAPSNSVVPAAVPGKPTGVSATPDINKAIVRWSPAASGGTPINHYTVTATPGIHSRLCAGSPCTLTGLANGTLYAITVTATNSVGTGLPSNPVTVTPGPPPPPPTATPPPPTATPPPPPTPPTASFTITCSSTSSTPDFDASASSTGSAGGPLIYDWVFGDGNTGSGVTTSHLYSPDGTFNVMLTVTGPDSLTNSSTQSVTTPCP